MLVCEAAGHDIIIVETVGVGQSETAVADMVDMFLLLLVPGGGDELQGIKKGIVELADSIIVTKADGDLAAAAQRAANEYSNAVHLLAPASPGWTVPVMTCSSVAGKGIDEIWENVWRYRDLMQAQGGFQKRRAAQAHAWMWSEIAETLLSGLRQDTRVAAVLPELERQVAAGGLAPAVAARQLVAAFRTIVVRG